MGQWVSSSEILPHSLRDSSCCHAALRVSARRRSSCSQWLLWKSSHALFTFYIISFFLLSGTKQSQQVVNSHIVPTSFQSRPTDEISSDQGIVTVPVVHILLTDPFSSWCCGPKSVFCMSTYTDVHSVVLAKNSMLLCYSLHLLIVPHFDDVNDDAEYHWHNICIYHICLALDVDIVARVVNVPLDVQRRMLMRVFFFSCQRA